MPPKTTTIHRKRGSGDNPHRVAPKAGLRSKSTIMRLNMYNSGKPVRNKEGKVIGGSLMMGNKAGGKDLPSMARIAPNRKFFGNTRTISQTDLDKFREEMRVKSADPYTVVLRRKKIPMALLQDSKEFANVNLLETESFDSIFSDKTKRKKPKLSDSLSSYESLRLNAESRNDEYVNSKVPDSNIEVEFTRGGDARKEDLFAKGQSKRIWAELYKVLDCSDVVLQGF